MEKDPSSNRKGTLNTPSQAGAYKSYAPSLSWMYLILEPLRDLVKIYDCRSFELMKLTATILMQFFSNEVAVHINMLGSLMKEIPY